MSRIAGLTSMQIEGLEELKEMLADLAPNEARNVTRAAVHGLAGRVRDRMKQRVAKRSGDLAASIRTIRRRGKRDFPVSEVRVGGGAPYGIMLEFGTSRTRAQPYIVPTVEELRGGVPLYFQEEVGKKLEKALERRARRGGK